MLSLVLIEPEKSGNIGAIARVMKNFDFKELVLINPKVNHLSQESRNRAKHAQDILKKAKVKDKAYLKRFDYLIGTTSKLGTDYNIPRSPVPPEKFAKRVAEINESRKKAKIALLIGREGNGLTNEEILECDFVVAIQSSKKYPALNISHAVSILLYELYKVFGQEKLDEHIYPATKIEKDQILKMVDKVLDKMKFATAEKKETQRIVWKRLVGKSFLTKREAYALMGFLRKLM